MSEKLKQLQAHQPLLANQLSPEAELSVIQAQRDLSHAVRNPDRYFISVDGPCPLTDAPELTSFESQQKIANAQGLAGYIALNRQCFFKPRSNLKDWHGMDQDQPDLAYKIVARQAAKHANITAEIGSAKQLLRYGSALTMMWVGGRNVNNTGLIYDLANLRRDIVLGVKNGLDGNIEPALTRIAQINALRGDQSAPAILIYRGGSNATSPQASQDAYKRAHQATNGKLFYDTAHGTEMAHNPVEFAKSVVGQVLSSRALVQLSQQGYAPLGKFSEASAIPAIMDPHMPLARALADSKAIYRAKFGG